MISVDIDVEYHIRRGGHRRAARRGDMPRGQWAGGKVEVDGRRRGRPMKRRRAERESLRGACSPDARRIYYQLGPASAAYRERCCAAPLRRGSQLCSLQEMEEDGRCRRLSRRLIERDAPRDSLGSTVDTPWHAASTRHYLYLRQQPRASPPSRTQMKFTPASIVLWTLLRLTHRGRLEDDNIGGEKRLMTTAR